MTVKAGPDTVETAHSVAPAAPVVSMQHTQQALQILALLATTLDLTRLIEIFAAEINRAVEHDGVSYEHEGEAIEVQIGTLERHSCSYRLTVEGEFLGQLRLTRRRKFDADELATLENLLVSLVYPLRNALKYKHALDQARRDPLTGSYNRGVMESVLAREVGLARRNGTPLSVIFMDVDSFKSINDTFGHAVGDQAILTVVACISQSVRNTDMVARYGGDEFVVLLNSTPLEGATLLAERIRSAVGRAECRGPAGERIPLSVSLGVAALTAADTPKSLLERADSALNQAKLDGRNVVRA
jgi:diguanylate cyclase (GGDEF)-like protein